MKTDLKLWMRCHGEGTGRKSTPRTLVPSEKQSQISQVRLVVRDFSRGLHRVHAARGSSGVSVQRERSHHQPRSRGARSLEHMWVVDQLYDGLVELGPDLTVLPCLASLGRLTKNGWLTSFGCARMRSSRPGVPFKPTTWSILWSGLRDPKVVSSGGWILDAVRPQGIVALNDSTVEVRLREAYPPFLGLLTTAYGSVITVRKPHPKRGRSARQPCRFRTFPVGMVDARCWTGVASPRGVLGKG